MVPYKAAYYQLRVNEDSGLASSWVKALGLRHPAGMPQIRQVAENGSGEPVALPIGAYFSYFFLALFSAGFSRRMFVVHVLACSPFPFPAVQRICGAPTGHRIRGAFTQGGAHDGVGRGDLAYKSDESDESEISIGRIGRIGRIEQM